MRVAIVSDIHGNLIAIEAVLADLQDASPDLILHGGDLADGGSSPAAVVDLIRDLGWLGVAGNADEMLWNPGALEDFAASSSKSPKLQQLFSAVGEVAAFTRDALGEARIAWLRALPKIQTHDPVSLVHASPGDLWRAPGPESSDEKLRAAYGPLGSAVAVWRHIHRPYIRSLPGMTVANSGSVSLSYDGDRRAAYLLIDGFTAAIRRVDYAVDREIRALRGSGVPHADWIAKMLDSGRPTMP